MTMAVALREALPEVRDIADVLRAVGVSSFEFHTPDGGAVSITFLPAASAAQSSTPEQTGNTGAQEPETKKVPDAFDVIESQRAPGAPGPDGLPSAGRAG